jgi:hypothetical protein
MIRTTIVEAVPVKTIGRWSSQEHIKTSEEAKEFAALVLQETSEPNLKSDIWWERVEQRLLEALILYTSTEWPPHKRNLGDLREYLAEPQLDERFTKLPPGHSALLPYEAIKSLSETMRYSATMGLFCRLENSH